MKCSKDGTEMIKVPVHVSAGSSTDVSLGLAWKTKQAEYDTFGYLCPKCGARVSPALARTNY